MGHSAGIFALNGCALGWAAKTAARKQQWTINHLKTIIYRHFELFSIGFFAFRVQSRRFPAEFSA